MEIIGLAMETTEQSTEKINKEESNQIMPHTKRKTEMGKMSHLFRIIHRTKMKQIQRMSILILKKQLQLLTR